jgi:hypothetical protein
MEMSVLLMEFAILPLDVTTLNKLLLLPQTQPVSIGSVTVLQVGTLKSPLLAQT